MRIQLTAFAAVACFAYPAFAEQEFSFSLGLMQRSYSDNAVIMATGFGLTPALDAEDTEVAGLAFDGHLMGEESWMRLMVYADDFDATLSDPDAIAFPVAPSGVGIFGPGGFSADFERDTGLLRFDVMQNFANISGIDIYGGASLVQLHDDVGAVITALGFPGTTNNVQFAGRSDLIGLVLGARYDFDPGVSSSGLTFSAFGTIGAYHASHSMAYSALAVGALVLDEQASASDSGMTGAAEFGLTANYSLSENSHISLTYQAAFYGDAINSPGTIALTNRGGGTVTTGLETDSVLYQGLSLSYVLQF